MEIRTEPDAETRRAAKNIHQMYIALMQEGFTEEQALKIVGSILSG